MPFFQYILFYVLLTIVLSSCGHPSPTLRIKKTILLKKALLFEQQGDSLWQVSAYKKSIQSYDSAAIFLAQSKHWDKAFALKHKLILGLDSLDSLKIVQEQIVSIHDLIYPRYNPPIDRRLANIYMNFGFRLYHLKNNTFPENNPSYHPATYANFNRAYNYFSQEKDFPEDSLETLRQHTIIHAINLNKFHETIHLAEMSEAYLQKKGEKIMRRLITNILAIAYAHTGSYQKAEQCFHKSLNIIRSLNDTLSLAYLNRVNNLGKLNYDLFKPEKSLIYLNNALKVNDILNQIKPSLAPTLAQFRAATYVHFGFTWHQMYLINKEYSNKQTQEKYLNRTIKYVDSAITIHLQRYKEDLGAKKHYGGMALAYINKGLAYMAKKQYTQALLYLQKSINLLKHLPLYPQLGLTYSFNRIAQVYYETDEYKKALFFSQKALQSNVFDFTENNPANTPPATSKYISIDQFRESIWYKARVYVKLWKKHHIQYYYRQALKNYKILDEVIINGRKDRLYKSEQIEVIEFYQDAYGEATALCLQNKDYEQALYFSEQSKSAVLYEQLSESSARKYANIPQKLLNKERRIKSDISYYRQELHKLYSLNSSKQQRGRIYQKTKAYQDTLYSLDQRLSKLVNNFESNYPDYYNLKYNHPRFNLADIQQKLLDKNTAAVSYVLGKNHLSIFALNQDTYQFKVINLPKKHVSRLINSFKNKISAAGSNFEKDAFKLYQALLEPIQRVLKGKTNLLIIPSGALAQIPFEALIDQPFMPGTGTPHYLIKKYAIQYYPTLTLATKAIQKSRQSKYDPSLTAFLPIFDQIKPGLGHNLDPELGSLTLEPLHTSEETLRQIKTLFHQNKHQVKAYLRDQAREETIKNQKITSKYLLFFTHSVASEDPAASYIALHPQQNQDSREDGLLHIEEIFNLVVQSDLVILNSCQSGIGKELKGEGILSLGRGFMFCGTPNLIQSLWKIQEKSASKFLVTFFRHYFSEANMTYAKALEKTKCDFLKHPVYQHPYYWSPLVLLSAQKSIQ